MLIVNTCVPKRNKHCIGAHDVDTECRHHFFTSCAEPQSKLVNAVFSLHLIPIHKWCSIVEVFNNMNDFADIKSTLSELFWGDYFHKCQADKVDHGQCCSGNEGISERHQRVEGVVRGLGIMDVAKIPTVKISPKYGLIETI